MRAQPLEIGVVGMLTFDKVHQKKGFSVDCLGQVNMRNGDCSGAFEHLQARLFRVEHCSGFGAVVYFQQILFVFCFQQIRR